MGIHDEEIQTSFALSIDVLNARLNRTLPEELDNLSVDDSSVWQVNVREKDEATVTPLYRRLFRTYNIGQVSYDDDEHAEDNYGVFEESDDQHDDYEQQPMFTNDDYQNNAHDKVNVQFASASSWKARVEAGQEYDHPKQQAHYPSNDVGETAVNDDECEYSNSRQDFADEGQSAFDEVNLPTNWEYAEEDDEEQQTYTAPPLLMISWKLIFQFYELYRPNLLPVVREQQYRPHALGRMCQTMRETFEPEWNEFVGGNVQLMYNDLYGQYQRLSQLVREMDEDTFIQDKHKVRGEIFGCIYLLYEAGASEESAQQGEQNELDELLIQFHALAKIFNETN